MREGEGRMVGGREGGSNLCAVYVVQLSGLLCA